jgi:hypothetical protein
MQSSPNRSGLPSKTPSPAKRNSPYNHIPLSAHKPNQLSANKMSNRLLQLAEVRKKSELIEVPKPHKQITIEELTQKKTEMWKKISFITRENRCVGKNQDFIELRDLIVEYSKITPAQTCSAVKDAMAKGYYLNEEDHLINPAPEQEYTYGHPAPKASAPPANEAYYEKLATAPPLNFPNSPRVGGTKRRKLRKQRKTRRSIN